jgi:hypothetical protein
LPHRCGERLGGLGAHRIEALVVDLERVVVSASTVWTDGVSLDSMAASR